jgi:hypothetical protein
VSVDWATVAVTGAAVATAVSAVFTARMAIKTGDLAKAANKEAAAVVDQGEVLERQATAMAELAEEARRDRELAWQPLLTLENLGFSGNANARRITVRVTNVGSGPALNSSIFVSDGGQWGQSPRFVFRSGDEDSRSMNMDSLDRSEVFEPTPGFRRVPSVRQGQLPPELVALCTDALGRRWRFSPGWPNETVGPDAVDQPTWLRWVRDRRLMPDQDLGTAAASERDEPNPAS